jgi:hypothetical protein
MKHEITDGDIRTAFRSGEASKRDICRRVAENMGESFCDGEIAYDDAGVYHTPPGRVVLVMGWDLFGNFRHVVPALDVTEHVKRDGLTFADAGNGPRPHGIEQLR